VYGPLSSIWITDPLADVHAYYAAGARLNAGQPLYLDGGFLDIKDQYLYPPLLAIAFRPLALLPFAAIATALLLTAIVLSVLHALRVI